MVSRRWALFAVTVVVLAYGCLWLGQWQFHRLHDREATNTQTRANLRADPAPVGDVLAPGRPTATRDEWRRVERPPAPTARPVHGDPLPDPRRRLRRRRRHAAAHRRRPAAAGRPGLAEDRQRRAPTRSTPLLRRRAGHGRGLGPRRTPPATRPPSPTGRPGRSPAREIAQTLGGPVYGGFVDAETESPAARHAAGAGGAAGPRQRPALLLRPAVVVLRAARGVRVLLPRLRRAQEAARRQPRRPRRTGPGRVTGRGACPPSTGSITPLTKLAAGESRNAAARPNSSGRP